MGEASKYGPVVFAPAAFVGWITGMGGSLLRNLGYSALMGLLAALLFLHWRANSPELAAKIDKAFEYAR